METEPSLDGLDRITQPRTWGVFWRHDNGGGGVCCWHLDGPWQVGKLNPWMVYLQLNCSNHWPQSSGVTGLGEPEWWGTDTYGHLEIRYNSHAPQIQSRGSKMEEKEQADQVQELRGPHRLEVGWLGLMALDPRRNKDAISERIAHRSPPETQTLTLIVAKGPLLLPSPWDPFLQKHSILYWSIFFFFLVSKIGVRIQASHTLLARTLCQRLLDDQPLVTLS